MVVLAGAVIGILIIPVNLRKDKNLLFFSGVILFACVFPLAYAIYKKSSLYDGWRHFLFIYPPIVIIASTGWMALMQSKQKVLGYVTGAVVAAGLISPTRFTIVNHPFESLYFNEIAGGLKNVYGKFETDYYMLGVRPAFEWLVKNEHLGDKSVVINTNCTFPLLAYNYRISSKNIPWKYDMIYEQYADFHHDELFDSYEKQYPDFKDKNLIGVDYVNYKVRYSKDWDYCILFSRYVDEAQLTSGNWPPPETIHTIDVDGVPVAAILKRKTKKDMLGFQLMKAKKTDEAKAMFLQSLVEYPENELVWQQMAQIYGTEGKPDSAIYAAKKALQRNPGEINMYELAGQILIKAGKMDSAIALYKTLEKYDPGYSHYFIGYANAVKGNVSAAYNEIDLAIEADPSNQAAYKLGIQIAQQTKNNAKAQEYYEKAKKEFPEEEK